MKRSLSLLLLSLLLFHGCTDALIFLKDEKTLTGMGATFSVPFYNTLFTQYNQNSGNTIINNASDSEFGIRCLQDRTVDFIGIRFPLSNYDLLEFPADILTIPVCMGAIVLAYHVPEISNLRLTPSLISDIFLGNVNSWDDPAIRALNPGIELPPTKITIIHRSDESGANYVFSDYLCKTSPEWEEKMGKGKALNWRRGIGANGSIETAATIKQMKGSIGYIGSEYASMFELPAAEIQNAAGNFVKADRTTIQSAAETDHTGDMRITITNSSHENAYPLSSFSWFLVYKNQAQAQRSEKKYEILKDFLLFTLNPEQQKLAGTMSYVPLPETIREEAKKQIEKMEWKDDER